MIKRVFILLLVAFWTLTFAELASLTFAGEGFQITRVDPPELHALDTIKIHIDRLYGKARNVRVFIGDQPALILHVSQKLAAGDADITARVPGTLSQLNLHPIVRVSIDGVKDSFGPPPKIVMVKPEVQRKGYPITIEIDNVPENNFVVRVTIGGERAEVQPLSGSRSGQVVITATVPTTLSDTDLHPTINVFLDTGIRVGLIRYEGNFAIQQEIQPALSPRPESSAVVFLRRYSIVLSSVALAIGVALAIFYVRRRRMRLNSGSSPTPSPFSVDDLDPMDIPEPPPDLIAVLSGGRCVSVLGPGMRAEAGLSTISDLLNGIISRNLKATDATQLHHKLLEAGRADAVLDSLNSILPAGLLASEIAQLIEKERPRSMSAYSRLAELPLSAVVSLNLDDLAAKAFRKREPPVFLPGEAERCLDVLSRHGFFIFMLRGAASSPEEILLSQQNLKDAISRNDAFRDLLNRLYYARPLLFLGMNLSGLQSFLQLIDRTAPPTQRHFALVEVNDTTWAPIARSIESSYGLTVLPFTPEKSRDAIATFLRHLGNELGATTASVDSPPAARISSLELNNIGPFIKCNLELDPNWTVILGDNGVGKSTVLRALAVCIGGKATEASAARLLRSGATAGSISLTIGDREYLTTIRRKSGGGVTVESPSGVPLEREAVLAVGFSALRTVGWQRGKLSEATPKRPNASDLIPLTSEEPDPRLDGVKQWIVRLDHLKTGEGVSEDDRKRYGALYDHVFELFGKLAAGVDIKPGGVDPHTDEIIITTKDGPISFESLSQGTLSLVGWAGTLMQRLYETAPAGVEPLKSAAIVLVDEIDAHMHPAWQQTLVIRLSEIFENTQFIVTSHSPLVVGGLEPNQVYRFERDADGVVKVTQPEYALKGLGAAGLLTSGLFGLASHLDIETSEALDRKRQLTAKKLDSGRSIGDDELKELDELEKKTADVDFTSAVRDPMYKRFVDAVSKAEATAQEPQGANPVVLTSAEKEEKAKLAEKIVRELMSNSDTNARSE